VGSLWNFDYLQTRNNVSFCEYDSLGEAADNQVVICTFFTQELHDDCREECNADINCLGFTVNNNGLPNNVTAHTCSLFSSYSGTTTTSNFVSYVKTNPSCAITPTAAPVTAPPTAATTVTERIAEGGLCSFDFECEPGNWCHELFNPQRCQPQAQNGGICEINDGGDRGCLPYLHCIRQSQFTASSYRCTPRKHTGEFCVQGSDCIEVAVQFLYHLRLELDCEPTAKFQPKRIAEELYYSHKYPNQYLPNCGDPLTASLYRFKDGIYRAGFLNAPCVTNAQCRQPFYTCVNYRCLFNFTSPSICPAGSDRILPDYYGLVPKDTSQVTCGGANAYTSDSNDPFDYVNFQFPTGNPANWFSKSYYFWSSRMTTQNNLAEDFLVRILEPRTFGPDLHRFTGNDQSCGMWGGSDELVETGFGVRTPLEGWPCERASIFTVRKEAFENWNGHFHRLIPHNMVSKRNLRRIECFRNGDSWTDGINRRTVAAPFAFESPNQLGGVIDALYLSCSRMNDQEGRSLGDRVTFEMTRWRCDENVLCKWNKALGKCVASRKYIENNACFAFDGDKAQCRLVGFCTYSDETNRCISRDDEASGDDVKKIICSLQSNPGTCVSTGCFWDLVERVCEALEEDVEEVSLGFVRVYKLSRGGWLETYANYNRPVKSKPLVGHNTLMDPDFEWIDGADEEFNQEALERGRGPCQIKIRLSKEDENGNVFSTAAFSRMKTSSQRRLCFR